MQCYHTRSVEPKQGAHRRSHFWLGRGSTTEDKVSVKWKKEKINKRILHLNLVCTWSKAQGCMFCDGVQTCHTGAVKLCTNIKWENHSHECESVWNTAKWWVLFQVLTWSYKYL